MEDVTEFSDDRLDSLLREGLRETHTPAVSRDFDERVLRTVRHRPWWNIQRSAIRPRLLVPAMSGVLACAATLTLALIIGTGSNPRVTPTYLGETTVDLAMRIVDGGGASAATFLLMPVGNAFAEDSPVWHVQK